MKTCDRRSFMQKSLVTGMGMAVLSVSGVKAENKKNIAPITIPTGKRTNKPFRFGVLTETVEIGRKMDKAYDEAIVPIELMIKPMEHNSKWPSVREEIESWGFPVRSTSHYPGPSQPFTGPDVDFDLVEFYAKRAVARSAELGVKVIGIYGLFFPVPEGFSKNRAIDQAIRFCNMLADLVEPKNMFIALEPMGKVDTLWPLYLDAVEFAQRVDRHSIRCMADTNYFISRNQDLRDIAKYPEYCIHADTQGVDGQPGVGNRVKVHTEFFRVLRDIGYENCVSFACPWRNTIGSTTLDMAAETRKSLAYAKKIRDQVYAE
jgi:sugar phosphate isomerase/epimerase